MNGFLGSAILETAIGAAFVYLLLAIFCTATVEWIAGLLATRSNTLRGALLHLLGDQTLAGDLSFLSAFYRHPIISILMKDGEHPTYISPRAFSTALLDLALEPASLPAGEVRTTLLAILHGCHGDSAQLQTGLENWFNDAMHRASCIYQKQTKTWTFLVAVAITVATNADTFQLLRQPGHLNGWVTTSPHLNLFGWLARLTGWLLTVGAVSLGAPFWFDVLNRFVNLRNTGKPPLEPEKATIQPAAAATGPLRL